MSALISINSETALSRSAHVTAFATTVIRIIQDHKFTVNHSMIKRIATHLPADMLYKLRLDNSTEVCHRMSHLWAVCELAIKHSAISIEGYPSAEFGDEDISVWDGKMLTVVDVTFDPSLTASKKKKLHARNPTAKCEVWVPAERKDFTVVLPDDADTIFGASFKFARLINQAASSEVSKFVNLADELFDQSVRTWDLEMPLLDVDMMSLYTTASLKWFTKPSAETAVEIVSSSNYASNVVSSWISNPSRSGPFLNYPAAVSNELTLTAGTRSIAEIALLASSCTADGDVKFIMTSGAVVLAESVPKSFLKNIANAAKLDSDVSCCFRKTEKFLQIIFNPTVIQDENYTAAVSRALGNRFKKEKNAEAFDTIAAANYDVEESDFINFLTDDTGHDSHTTSKMMILADDIIDTKDMIKKSFIKGFLSALSKMNVSNAIELTAATARLLLSATMARGPANTVVVKKVEGLDAVVVAWKTGSLDKFETVPYVLAYKPSSNFRSRLVRNHTEIKAGFLTTGYITADRRLISSRIRMVQQFMSVAFLFAELDQPAVLKGDFTVFAKEMFNIAATMYVNNDLHAQMIEKYRYLMVNAYDRNANVAKVFSKLSSAMPKTEYEKSTICKMIASHSAVKFGFMANQEVLKVITYDYETAFTGKVRTFDKLVNLMYFKNLYNKFRTSGTMSAALVYHDLLEEEEQFRTVSIQSANGMTNTMYNAVMAAETLSEVTDSLKANQTEEAEFITSCSNSERFKFSAVMVAAAGMEHRYTEDPVELFKTAATSNVLEFCSMKGAMASGPVVRENQSCRSAESIIKHIAEELTVDHTLFSISDLNNCSLYALKLVQSYKPKVEYACRITPKDQVGNREISVLNSEARIGVGFTESFFKSVAKLSETDMLNKANKAEVFLKMVVSDKDLDSVYDSNDQSRWGPNTNMSFLAIATACFTREAPTLFNMLMNTHYHMSNKRAKVPEQVLDLFASKSMAVSKKSALAKVHTMMNKMGVKLSFKMQWGMFQGIMHQESSTAHDLMCHRANKLAAATINAKIQHLVTSDDCFRLIKKTEDTKRIEIANFIGKVMSTMNAIRNIGKSCLSEVMGEFNSMFVFRKSLAVPSIKNRYSLIDCSTGGYPMSDIVNAASSGSVAVTTGDSEAGGDMISLGNLTLVLDSYGLFEEYITKKCQAISRIKISTVSTMFFKPYAPFADAVSRDTSLETALKLVYPLLDLRAAADATVDVSRRENLNGDSNLEFFLKPAVANWVNQKMYPRHMMTFAKNVKLKIIYETACYDNFDPAVATGKNFLFHFSNTFIWASLDDTTFDFCRRYGEGYMSKTKPYFKNIKTGVVKSLADLMSMTAAELTSDVVIPDNKANALLSSMISDTVFNYQGAESSVTASERGKWFVPEFMVTKGIKSIDIMKKSIITNGFLKRSLFETMVASNNLDVDKAPDFYEPIDFARAIRVTDKKGAFRVADACMSMISGVIKPTMKVCMRTMSSSKDPASVVKDILFNNRFYYDRKSDITSSVVGMSYSSMPATAYLSTLSECAAAASNYMAEMVWSAFAKKEIKLDDWKETAIVDNMAVITTKREKDHYVESDSMAVNMAAALITAPNKVNKSFIKASMAFKLAYKLPPKKCIGASSVTNYYGKVMLSQKRGFNTFAGYHYSVYDGAVFKHFVIMEDSFQTGTLLKFSSGASVKSSTYLGMGRELQFEQTTRFGPKDTVYVSTIPKWVMSTFDPTSNVMVAALTLPLAYIYPTEPEKEISLLYDSDNKVNETFLRENIGKMESLSNAELDQVDTVTLAMAIRSTTTSIDYARKCASELMTLGAYSRFSAFMGAGDETVPDANFMLADDIGIFDSDVFEQDSDEDSEMDLKSAFMKAAMDSSDEEEGNSTTQDQVALAEASTIFSYRADAKGNNSLSAVRGMRLYAMARHLITAKVAKMAKINLMVESSYKGHIIALFLFVANADVNLEL